MFELSKMGIIASLAIGCAGTAGAGSDRASEREASQEDATQVAPADRCTIDSSKTEPGVCGCGVPEGTCSKHSRIVVVGDVHGDFSALVRALKLSQIIDNSNAWVGGLSLLVQTGDVLDRGEDDKLVVDFLVDLKGQAQGTGGDVVQLMGNHELMNLQADLRYVAPGSCGDFLDVKGLDLDQKPLEDLSPLPEDCRKRAAAFVLGGPYADLLSDYPAARVIGNTVFVHGGILPQHLSSRDLSQINGDLKKWAQGSGGTYEIASEMLWDRTYSEEDQLPVGTCNMLGEVLSTLGVVRMVVGHSVQGHINAACGGSVWRVDVGMSSYYGGPIEVMEIRDGQISVLSL